MPVWSTIVSVASAMKWVTTLAGASEAEMLILSRTDPAVTVTKLKPHWSAEIFLKKISTKLYEPKQVTNRRPKTWPIPNQPN